MAGHLRRVEENDSIHPFDTIKIAQLQLSYNAIGKRKANVVNLQRSSEREGGGRKERVGGWVERQRTLLRLTVCKSFALNENDT